jgi:membrane-associated protease RseP (regulator of RpoE activity)
VNPDLPPDRPRIGVVLDQSFEGEGLRVAEVQEGTPAAAAGVEAGDVLTGFDDQAVRTIPDLQRAIAAKKPGDAFRVKLSRGAETIELEGKLAEGRAAPALRRGKPYGTIRAEAKDNVVEVRADGVASFELFLGEPRFDLERPVIVRVNGVTLHEGVVAPDLRFLAAQAAADDDRTMVYLARLRITVGS